MKRTLFITMITAALMGSAYANTDYTATPGAPQSIPPRYVYGTYFESGEASGGSVEVREVSASEGYEYLMYVYGGYTRSGDATGNTVDMNGGVVYGYVSGDVIDGGDVYGGYVKGDGDATGNTVTMTGGEVYGYVYGEIRYGGNVYGGYTRSGNVTGNTVTMNGGEVAADVCGGLVQDTGDATENAVTINDGHVRSDVYGGYVGNPIDATGNAVGNTVTMTGVVVGGGVYGGVVTHSGDATGNTVTMTGVEVYGYGGVYGGYVMGDGDATGNTVTMTGGEVRNNVFGGFSYSGNATGNTVTMNGGEVDGWVWGGFMSEGSGEASGNTVDMNGGEVYGWVYGGSVGDAIETTGNAVGNTVTMTDGVVGGGVVGGHTYSGKATDNTVVMNGGEVDGWVWGGHTHSGEASGNTVTMTGGSAEEVTGGFVEGDGDATENAVTINDGYVACDVLGGYVGDYVDGIGDATGNAVTMNGGEVGDGVYGGYVVNSGDATGNTVTIAGGAVGDDVYGGCTYSGDATGNTVRLVGSGASYTAGDTTYQGGEIAIQGSVYAGSLQEGGISENNTVHIHGTGIGIGGTIDDSQQLTFHLVQGQAGAPGTPMVTLGGALNLEGVELGFYGDAVTDWAAFEGESITLVSMTSVTITGLIIPSDPVDILDAGGTVLATASMMLSDDAQTLSLQFAGGHTSYTANPGSPQTSAPDSIFGAYSETGNVTGGSVGVFEVESGGYSALVEVSGGYAKAGNVSDCSADMTGGSADAVYGGFSGSGDATNNTANISGGSAGEVTGGLANGGDATGNTVTMNGGEVGGNVNGGYVGNSGDATGNTVDMSGGMVNGDVRGGYAYSSGKATDNTVTMTGGEVGRDVYGGYTYSGNATGNAVDMTGGEVGRDVYGGYTYSGNATGNAVTMTGGEVDGYVYGGYTYSGDASGNTVKIADSTVGGEEVLGYIYGGNTEEGDANDNTVTVTGGQAEAILGGEGNNANGNNVTVTDATIEYEVYGGLSVNSEWVYSGTANDNTVTMNGGQVEEICAAKGYSTIGNTVVMNGGLAGSILAGTSYGGENSGNTVIVTEGVVLGGIGGGYLYDDGELRDNRVYLVGKGATATIGGKQYTGGAGGIQAGAIVAAMADKKAYHYVSSGNSIDVYGTGTTAGMVGYMEALTFHLGDGLASAGTPMLTITDDGLNLVLAKLGFRGDDVTDWSKFEGRSITLVQAADNVTGVDDGTEVNITGEGGKTLATATLSLGSGNALVLNFSGVAPTGQTSYTANPGSPQTTAPNTIYGAYAETGDVTGGSAAVFEVATGGYESLGNVYGGYAKSGNVSGCTATMDSGSAEWVYGGWAESGDATGNTVNISGGAVEFDVYGGYTKSGNVSGCTANMDSGSAKWVYGGDTYSGNATDNNVTMTGGEVGYDVLGGYTLSGNVSGNTVTMSGGEVHWDVYGGFTASGNATGNTVNMSGGSALYVYGAEARVGNATGNTVTMTGGEVGVVYGAEARVGNATGNTVIMTGGSALYVYGAEARVGNATGNTVIMTGGEVDDYVCGGYVDDSGDAIGNTVTIAGGDTYSGNATDNTVTMTGGEVGDDVYGGYTYSGEASGNAVHLVGEGASYTAGDTTYQGSEIAIQGSVYAGAAGEGGISENNTVHIHGTGIGIGGTIDSCQRLTFHLAQGQAGGGAAPMVTLGGALDLEGVELVFNGDAVTDWAAFKGKSITLVQAAGNVTGVEAGTELDITDAGGNLVATATLTLLDDQMPYLTNIQGVTPVPPPAPGEGPDALDVALVNSLWASSAYVREFVRLSEAQGYSLKEGDTAVWGGGFGTFMHAAGGRGFKSNGGGYGLGVRHAFSAATQAGLSFGQGFGSYHNSGADGATVHQRATLAAATASTRITKDFSLGGHLAFGNVRNRADCRLDGASERARWNDNVFNLGAHAAYDFHVTETTAVTPFLGLDWMNGAHESFGGAYGRHYTHGRLNELRMPVGVTVSTSVEAGSAKLLPQLSVAYVPSLAQQLPHADVTGNGQSYRAKGYAPGRNAFMFNAGMNVLFSDSWSAGAFYTLETRRHSVDQSVNASVRYTF